MDRVHERTPNGAQWRRSRPDERSDVGCCGPAPLLVVNEEGPHAAARGRAAHHDQGVLSFFVVGRVRPLFSLRLPEASPGIATNTPRIVTVCARATGARVWRAASP